MRNRIYLWSGFGFLLAVAILAYVVVFWQMGDAERQFPNWTFALQLPFQIRIHGLWWLSVLPALWFLGACFLHKHVPNSTRLTLFYVITAVIASVVLGGSLHFLEYGML